MIAAGPSDEARPVQRSATTPRRSRVLALVALLFCVPGVSDAFQVPLADGWRFYFAGNDTAACSRRDTFPAGPAVSLPHVFPAADTSGRPIEGVGWYFRDLPMVSAYAGKSLFLDCGGACLRADVFVNGKPAGKSAFPYLPFRVDLTPVLPKKGSVRLAIRVDNRLREREVPDTRANGWWMHGGLDREVALSVLPKARIDGASVRTVHHSGDTFDLHINLAHAAPAMWDSVTIALAELRGGRPLFTARMSGTDTVLCLGGLRAWSPESPDRYRITLVPYFKGTPGDTVRLLRGFCQLTAQGPRLFLNGKPVYLRGMGRHDFLGVKGPLLTRQERLRDLLDLKALGVNFLRIAHFPQHRDVYELCDSLGILVMDEMPAWKTDAAFLGSSEGRAYGAAYMRALVKAHGNHTGICLWSIGNQFASYKDPVARFAESATRATKTADPSRLVTYCSYYYLWDKGFPHVDVISLNEYFGWELGSLPLVSLMLDKVHCDWPGKPLIVSEFGAQAGFGIRNPQPQLAGVFKSVLAKDLSEEHQALYLQSHIDTIWSRRSFVNGMVVWAYADYRAHLNKARSADMPPGLNACGIVTEERNPKWSHDAVRERYLMIRSCFEAENARETGRRRASR
ncbi:MAG: hypothetical protein JXA71_01465 [Chitinispirillaceae bacterium]|nr:hypothetical protein [Chitinispirillaceae bacterium]